MSKLLRVLFGVSCGCVACHFVLVDKQCWGLKTMFSCYLIIDGWFETSANEILTYSAGWILWSPYSGKYAWTFTARAHWCVSRYVHVTLGDYSCVVCSQSHMHQPLAGVTACSCGPLLGKRLVQK
jgi:hypothetical protein